MKKRIIFLALLIQFSFAHAGGSNEIVLVKEFKTDATGAYTLVVEPKLRNVPGHKDPYMGECKVFTVHGEYDEKWWKKHHGAKKELHIKAIEFLKRNINKTILFGWMDGGFKVIDTTNPCVVKSKGLELWKVKDGYTVLSYYYGFFKSKR
jgi:hypothetical protein